MNARGPMKTRIILFLIFLCGSITAGAIASTAEDYYRAGLGFYIQKQYEKAIPYFREAIHQDPNDWRSYQAMGQAFYLSGDIKTALAMFDESLRIHPNNAQLQRFTDQLRLYSSNLKRSLKPAKGQAPATVLTSPGSKITAELPQINAMLENNRVFARVIAGPYLGFFDDLTSGQGVVNGLLSTSQTHEVGSFIRSEVAYSWDTANAIGLSFELIDGGKFQWVCPNATQTLSPQLFSVSVIDNNFWPDPDGRWFAQLGFGLYFANVAYSIQPAAGYYFPGEAGSMSGSTLGASCSAGRQFVLFGTLALDLTAGFRFAEISQVTGTYDVGDGTTSTVTLANDAERNVFLADESLVKDSSYRAAAVDFSSFDLGIGLELDFQ